MGKSDREEAFGVGMKVGWRPTSPRKDGIGEGFLHYILSLPGEEALYSTGLLDLVPAI